ncbi:MAG: DNA ligase [bacterium]|nr:DNA ligase [bacterium]
MSAPFADFAILFEQLRHTRGLARQRALFLHFFQSLSQSDQAVVQGWADEENKLRLQSKPLIAIAMQLTGWDAEVIGWVQKSEGSLPAAIGSLLPAQEDDPELTLGYVETARVTLRAASSQKRYAYLAELLGMASPVSATVLLKLIAGQLPLGMLLTPETPPERPFTFRLVIVAASADHADRMSLLSDYTIAVWHEGHLLSIGTVWEGLEAATQTQLTSVLNTLIISRKGPVVLVEPRIVLEVACSGVAINRRRQAGYALQAPAIVRWLPEVAPEAADSLEQVLRTCLQQPA